MGSKQGILHPSGRNNLKEASQYSVDSELIPPGQSYAYFITININKNKWINLSWFYWFGVFFFFLNFLQRPRSMAFLYPGSPGSPVPFTDYIQRKY